VVRANAAAGCGAIGDASSIPRLIRALDLESGLSRGCIVRALGELRAAEALPHLQRIYLDTRNDEERHSGAGFRAMQAQAVMTAHYESLGSIDALGKDWDELKAAALPKPLDPARDEPLLTSEDVLEAMSKIGPGRAQDLCRALAGDKNPQARRVAARGLGEGVASDQARNLPILQALRSDAAPGVQVAAVVSLLLLEQIAERQRVLGGLEGEAWQKELYVRELARLPKAKLDFARDALRKCTTDKALGNETKKIAKRLAE
jgi:HEAT repeat protein